MPDIRTPTPPLPVFTNGEFVTQRRLNAIPEHILRLFAQKMGGFRTEKPMVVVTNSAASVPNNAYQTRSWGTEVLDTDGMWSISDPTSIYINTPGVYLVEFQFGITAPSSAATNSYLAGLIYANGLVPDTDAIAINRARAQTGQATQVSVAVPVPLDANTVLRFGVVQVTGATQTADLTNGGNKASAEWLGPLDRARAAVSV